MTSSAVALNINNEESEQVHCEHELVETEKYIWDEGTANTCGTECIH
jgi:hypothetical protein